jgi:crotonobetainyl-CoA:carnitine CoA-transferase CaiB-like acyl-CoA transferase
VRLHAPGLGEHTAQVMAELGWTDEQIATLHP